MLKGVAGPLQYLHPRSRQVLLKDIPGENLAIAGRALSESIRGSVVGGGSAARVDQDGEEVGRVGCGLTPGTPWLTPLKRSLTQYISSFGGTSLLQLWCI